MNQHRLTPLVVGECPEDWHKVFIDELTELLTNGYVGPSLPYQTDDPENGVRYLQGFNVRPNKIDFSNATWVTKEFHEKNAKSCLREGDLLVVQSGHIGTAAVVPDSAAGSNCHALIINRFDRSKADPRFVSQYINSEIGQARLRGLQVGSSMLHINTSELGRFILPLPPIDEQRQLAGILGVWDEAIETTEKLIAAKQLRYRALQILLLGKGLWSESRHQRADGLFDPSGERNRPDLPVLAVTQDQGVVPRTMLDRRITMELSDPATFKVVRKDDFVISLRSFQGGLEHSAYEGLVSPAYTVLRCGANLNPRFYRHYLKSPDFLKRLAVAVIGIRDGKQINFTDFASIKLPLPPAERQTRIANILDESEREIALLRKQADQLRKEKRGLMQKLLTGQWRVKVPEPEAA